MAETRVIEIRLEDKELQPEKMSSRDIAKLLSATEQMLAFIVARDYPELALDEKEVTVGLSKIVLGSYGVQFESQYDKPVREAYNKVIEAVKSQDYEQLPTKSVEALKSIRSISRTYRTNTQFGYRNGTFIEAVSLSGNTPIEIVVPEIEGETVLYGELLRIGGESPPTAMLKLLDGTKLNCNVTEKDELFVAKQLGSRLYTEVGVRGTARWDLRDMSIIFFRIDELLSYEKKPITDAVENSHQLFGHHLEVIEDVESFMYELRNQDEDL